MEIQKVFEVKRASKLTEEDCKNEELRAIFEEYEEMESRYSRNNDIAIALYKRKVVARLEEYMEPEDVCFSRDLAPFLEAIEIAFSIGVAHGQWYAGYGCDPMRNPDLLKELENETTTTD
jgi:hypothetical protein